MDKELLSELRSMLGTTEAKKPKSQPGAVMARLKTALGDLLGEVGDLRIAEIREVRAMQAAAGAARVANNEAELANAPGKILHPNQDAADIEKLVTGLIQAGDQLMVISKQLYDAQISLNQLIERLE